MRNFKILLAVCASASLLACGGGGSGGSPPGSQIPLASAATPLSAANYLTVGTPTAAALTAASTVGDTFDTISRASAAANPSAQKLLNSHPMQLTHLALTYFQNREQAQITRSESQSCPGGGSLSGTANDADNSNSATAGDTLSLTANNCILTVGQPAANGTFSMAINALTRNAGGIVTNLAVRLDFINFSIDGSTLNGAALVTGSPNGAASIAYDNFTTIRRGATVIYNFTSSSTALGQVTIGGLITVNNNTYTLSTVAPIVYGAYRPVSGTLRLSDANSNRIELTPSATGGGSIDIRLYLAGSSTQSSSVNVLWSAI